MDREQTGNFDPATHQPSKAELEEDVSIDARPEALAWAMTRSGAERRFGVDELTAHTLTPDEMLSELIQLGYIVPASDDGYQPIMPSAFEVVPNYTTADSIPLDFDSDRG